MSDLLESNMNPIIDLMEKEHEKSSEILRKSLKFNKKEWSLIMQAIENRAERLVKKYIKPISDGEPLFSTNHDIEKGVYANQTRLHKKDIVGITKLKINK